MKELNSDFTNAKVGDSVYHLDGRVGKINSISPSLVFPISVRWASDSIINYTFDGKGETKTPRIFTHPVAIIHADDLENIGGFKERVMEVSDNGVDWGKRVVFAKAGGFFVAWSSEDKIERVDRTLQPSCWKFAREINHRAIEIKEQIAALQKELETIEDPAK
jgi:hypothetical protein